MTHRAQTHRSHAAAQAALGAALCSTALCPTAPGSPTSTERSGPQRTCSGCRGVAPQSEVLRVVQGPEGAVLVDLMRRLPGRGAWVHPTLPCIQDAVARGLARSFRSPITSTLDEFLAGLREAANRRVAGLLSAAWRAKKAAIGSTAVKECLERSEAALIVAAVDARAALATPGVQAAIAAGRAAAWGDRAALGLTVGRNEVGVLAILDQGLAQALAVMIRIAHLGEKHSDVDRAGGYPFREV